MRLSNTSVRRCYDILTALETVKNCTRSLLPRLLRILVSVRTITLYGNKQLARRQRYWGISRESSFVCVQSTGTMRTGGRIKPKIYCSIYIRYFLGASTPTQCTSARANVFVISFSAINTERFYWNLDVFSGFRSLTKYPRWQPKNTDNNATFPNGCLCVFRTDTWNIALRVVSFSVFIVVYFSVRLDRTGRSKNVIKNTSQEYAFYNLKLSMLSIFFINYFEQSF